MKITITALTLIILTSTSACGQASWDQQTNETRFDGGTALSLTYNAPPDSGKVHLIFVSSDSTRCYAGYQVADRFPPLKDFDVIVAWKNCGSETDVDSTSVQYLGEQKAVVYEGRSYPAESGAVFALVTDVTGGGEIRRVSGWNDLEGLPLASQGALRAFVRDSAGWPPPSNR